MQDLVPDSLWERAAPPTASRLGKIRWPGALWALERAVAWLHAFKRLRTRYERRADIYLGRLRLAGALICQRRLVTAS
jgi:hypothetical protein